MKLFENFEKQSEESPENLVEIYLDANQKSKDIDQFSELRKILDKFREDGRMKELVDYVDTNMSGEEKSDLKSWIIGTMQ